MGFNSAFKGLIGTAETFGLNIALTKFVDERNYGESNPLYEIEYDVQLKKADL